MELRFREHYLVTGSIAGAAKAAGVPNRTGYEIAARADADPEFAKACEEYRARVLPNAERMANAAMQLCLERLNREPPDPEKLMALGAQKVSVQDAGPQYAASLGKLLQAITMGRRHEADSIAPRQTDVRVIVMGPDSATESAPKESEPEAQAPDPFASP